MGQARAAPTKHRGETRYQSKHDLDLLGTKGVLDLRERAAKRLAAMRSGGGKALGVGGGGRGGGGGGAGGSVVVGGGGGSEGSGSDGASSASTALPPPPYPMELMAALAVELVCEVGPQTILRLWRVS